MRERKIERKRIKTGKNKKQMLRRFRRKERENGYLRVIRIVNVYLNR